MFFRPTTLIHLAIRLAARTQVQRKVSGQRSPLLKPFLRTCGRAVLPFSSLSLAEAHSVCFDQDNALRPGALQPVLNPHTLNLPNKVSICLNGTLQ